MNLDKFLFKIFAPNRKRNELNYFKLAICGFIAGAVCELIMIHWTVGEVNFYKAFGKNQARRIAEQKVVLNDFFRGRKEDDLKAKNE